MSTTTAPYAPLLPAAVVAHVEAYALAHLGEPLRLATLARLARRSRDYFSTCYRATTGETPMAMVRRLRLTRAAYLLRHTTLPLAQLAAEVGLADQAHLGELFKRHYGVSPQAYRAQQPAGPVESGDALTAVILAWDAATREQQADALRALGIGGGMA